MTKFSMKMLYKNPQWTGKTEAQLAQLRSVIEVRDRCQYDQRKKSCDTRLTINISGRRFQTYQSTLERYPNTLLGNQRRRALFYDSESDEYFFDRHCLSFESILYYYQSHGRLRRPDNVPLDTFFEEITFFDLGNDAIKQVRQDEDIEEAHKILLPTNRFCRHVWANLEYPQYSLTGKIFNIISTFFVILSAIELAVETLPKYREAPDCLARTNLTITHRFCSESVHSSFFAVQTICVCFFTIEFILRIICCPSYVQFIQSILNWIDLLAILPYYITLGLLSFEFSNETSMKIYYFLNILRLFRFIRIFKLYRNFQHVKSLHVLACTMKESIPDFLILLSILTSCGFIFGAAIFFAENKTNGRTFDSIPTATYYGIVTITSVGYGDLAPVTATGRALACVTSVFGITILSMLASVLVDRYQRVYSRKRFFNDEDVKEITLTNSMTRSSINGKSRQTTANFEPVHESYEEHEQSQHADQLSGKVRFILGYVSDDEEDHEKNSSDKIDGHENQLITKIAHEILSLNSNKLAT